MPHAIVLVERRHGFLGRGFLLRCHMQVEHSSKSVVSAAGWFFCLFEEGDANNDDDGHKACGKEGKQNDHLKYFLPYLSVEGNFNCRGCTNPRKRSRKEWCQEFRDRKHFQVNDEGLRWLLINAMFSMSGLLLVPQKPFGKIWVEAITFAWNYDYLWIWTGFAAYSTCANFNQISRHSENPNELRSLVYDVTWVKLEWDMQGIPRVDIFSIV